MALRDVKVYYGKMLGQYLECKADLEDFEKGLEDGYITEDQLADAREDVANIKNNLDRLSFVLHLFNLPNNKKQKVKYKNANESLVEYFERVSADDKSVIDENTDCLAHLKAELKSLKK